MQDFRALSYHTEYSCEGDFKRRMESAACFSAVFRHLGERKESITYKIKVYRQLENVKDRQMNNVCLLSKKDIQNYIGQLDGIVPVKAEINDKVDEACGSYYEIKLEVKDAIGIQHKYVLTWIRYLYEYPYNMYLMEAMKLRKEKEFLFDSIANLFNLVGSTMQLGGGHSVSYGNTVGPLTRKELASRLNKERDLNSVYNCKYGGKQVDTEDVLNDKRITWRDLEFWTSEDLYKNRLKIYIAKYKEIKKKQKRKDKK